MIFFLQIDDNLQSILKAELSAEMEKTERDLKRELSTDFLRWALVGVIGIDENFQVQGGSGETQGQESQKDGRGAPLHRGLLFACWKLISLLSFLLLFPCTDIIEASKERVVPYWIDVIQIR